MRRGWHCGLASGCYRCFIPLWRSSVNIQQFTPKAHWHACDCRQGKPPVTTSSCCPAAGHWKRPGPLSALGRRSNLFDLENKATGTEGLALKLDLLASFTTYQAMKAQTWERSWQRLKQVSWCSWTAGASRCSQMTLRRQETPCPTRSSTTTFPLEWWAGIFLIKFKV